MGEQCRDYVLILYGSADVPPAKAWEEEQFYLARADSLLLADNMYNKCMEL